MLKYIIIDYDALYVGKMCSTQLQLYLMGYSLLNPTFIHICVLYITMG